MVAAHRPARVVSYVGPDNVASAHIATSLGAVRETETNWKGAALDIWAYPRLSASQQAPSGGERSDKIARSR